MNSHQIDAYLFLRRQRAVIILILVVAGILVAGGIGSTGAADSASSQCVACHTDAAKLKPLTPADPPSAEEGEG
jgi:nitrate/TMAO reductase-like tetraheme cytochrome c subunit